MVNKVYIHKLLLGDDIARLLDQMTEDDFKPEAIIIIGLQGNYIRIRHSCKNLHELLGALIIAGESVRGRE